MFRDALKITLDERLCRRGVAEVWMDYKLRGNEPFDEQLREKVLRSATLLVVLSEAYLESAWCQRELEIFASVVGGAAGRIFLVHYEPVPSARWPIALHGLSSEKYRFYRQERDGAYTTPLGYPIPLPDNAAHAPFYDRLRELVPDLASKLLELARRGGGDGPQSPLASSESTSSVTTAGRQLASDAIAGRRCQEAWERRESLPAAISLPS